MNPQAHPTLPQPGQWPSATQLEAMVRIRTDSRLILMLKLVPDLNSIFQEALHTRPSANFNRWKFYDRLRAEAMRLVEVQGDKRINNQSHYDVLIRTITDLVPDPEDSPTIPGSTRDAEDEEPDDELVDPADI